MRIIVDADSTSSIKAISLFSKENDIKLFCFCDTDHLINLEYGKLITVSTGYQNVDMTIINYINKDDILITNDYGLALLALSRNCSVINDKGKIYTEENIDELNMIRHINRLNRKRKIKTKNIPKRNQEMEDNLIKNLNILLQNSHSN